MSVYQTMSIIENYRKNKADNVNNKSPSIGEKKTEWVDHLFVGFARENITSQVAPIALTKIMIKYYDLSQNIYLTFVPNMLKGAKLQIVGVNLQNKSTFQVWNDDSRQRSVSLSDSLSDYPINPSYCGASNITKIPAAIQRSVNDYTFNNNNLIKRHTSTFKLFFKCAGYDGRNYYPKQMGEVVVICGQEAIYAYTPEFRRGVVCNCGSIYSDSRQELLLVGGIEFTPEYYEFDDDELDDDELAMDDDDAQNAYVLSSIFCLNMKQARPNWHECGVKLRKPREGVSLCFDSTEKYLFIIGGGVDTMTIADDLEEEDRQKCDTVELLTIENDNYKNIKQLANMNKSRYRPGCQYLDSKNQIIAGGGDSNVVELYDCKKDTWITHSKWNENHKFPTFVVDNVCPNIIYVVGDCINDVPGECTNDGWIWRGTRYLGTIEWMDLREAKWNLYDKSVQELFAIDDHPTFHARHLF